MDENGTRDGFDCVFVGWVSYLSLRVSQGCVSRARVKVPWIVLQRSFLVWPFEDEIEQ